MVNTVQFTINLNGNAYTGIAQLDKALGKFNMNASSTPKLLERINGAAFKINNIFAAAQTTIGKVSGSIEKMIDVGSENELQKMNMTTLFKGNAKAAEEMFDKISQYGKVTVYDKAGLLEAQKTMMSFGLTGEKSFATLKQIGDIAMGDKQKMQSLALAFSQASSAGKLQGQDFLQLINAGFNPLQVISERTGKSMSVLKDEMSKGKITADMLSQAFQWATDEQGLFYNGAEKAGTTTIGRLNQIKDTFSEFIIGVFDKLKPVIDTCLDFATNVLGRLPGMFENVCSAIQRVNGFFSDFGPIITGAAVAVGILTAAMKWQDIVLDILIAKEAIIKFATEAWTGAQAVLNAVMNANPIGLIIAGVAALVGVIIYLCQHITGLSTLWDAVCQFLKYSFYAVVDGIKLYFETWVNGFLLALDKVKLGWYKFKEACGLGNRSENQAMINQINADVEARKQAILDSAKAVTDNATKAAHAFDNVSLGGKSTKKASPQQSTMSTNEQLVSAVTSGSNANSFGGGVNSQDTTAVATGGTRNTEIHISIGDMIKQVIFNGTTSENKQEIERNFAECLSRVLGMAQASIG